jgi:hypothetical protein
MGLFDSLIKKANAAIETKTEEFNKKVEEFQKKLTEPMDFSMQKNTESNKQNRIQKQIIKQFYADYPEKPYISADRESEWIERAEKFPAAALVQKQMMKRFADGLLPGHVYMLYWLKRYTNKKVPAYFEYKYGVDFEKEKEFLYSNGFLDEMNKPTEKGEAAIKRHEKVIENHTPPKPDRSIEGISNQILAQRDSLRRNGYDEYEFIASRNCCEVCAGLHEKHFPLYALKIGVNAPPMHEGCSCSICAYVDREEYEAWLDSVSKGNKRNRRK